MTDVPSSPAPSRLRHAAATFAQFAALWSIAFGQPVSDLLHTGPLIAAGWTRGEALATAVAFIVVPSVVLTGIVEALGLISRRLARVAQSAVVGALAGVWLAHFVVRHNPDDGPLIALVLVLGGLTVFVAHLRLEPVRVFSTCLVLAPLVSLATLGFASFSTPLLFTGAEARASAAHPVPVVLVVMDEFPVTSLEDGRGRLDSRRFPSFARFSGDATWFPNATSVSDETVQAVPAILTGRAPDPSATQARSQNVFTLLADSHQENVEEAVTHLCPSDVCPADRPESFRTRLRGLRPVAKQISLRQFLPRSIFDRIYPEGAIAVPFSEGNTINLIGELRRPAVKPRFSFLHLMLPHSPWGRLPDGRRYDIGLAERAWLPGYLPDPMTGFPVVRDDEMSRSNPDAVRQAEQAHLAQAQAADRQLGQVLASLRATGQYRRSLIIVMADHGASFVPGQPFRRLTRANAPQILGIPLFVKRPGQERGRTSDAWVRSTDALPTITAANGIRPRERLDGRSVFEPSRRPAELRAVSKFTGKTLAFAPAYLSRGRQAVRERQARVFGPGTQSVELFRTGPSEQLIGRPVGAARARGLRPAHVVLDRPGALRAVDPKAPSMPAAISGTISGAPRGSLVVIALNGRIVTTGRSHEIEDLTRFSGLVPPSALRPGRNAVQVLYR